MCVCVFVYVCGVCVCLFVCMFVCGVCVCGMCVCGVCVICVCVCVCVCVCQNDTKLRVDSTFQVLLAKMVMKLLNPERRTL